MPLEQGPFRTSSPPEARTEPPRSIGAFRLRCADDPRPELIALGVVLPFFGALVGSAFGGTWLALESAAIGAAFAAAAALFLKLRGATSVDLHEDGLVLRRSHASAREIPFDDVDLVFVSVLRSRLPPNLALGNEIVVTLHDGERIALPGGRHLAPLVAPLQRRCSRPLVEPAREALAAGDLARFGPITLSREGARVNGAEKPWAEISRVTFELDEITFYGARGWVWRAVAIKGVPHLSALATLLEDKTRVEHLLPWLLAYFSSGP